MASSRRTRPTRRTKLRAVDEDQARRISRRLRAWFRKQGRDLPWRRTRNPYHILVSELMLQQTQVSRVLEYYERFTQRFPTLDDLAGAPRRDVLSAWSGLGYYARARNLHSLAGMVTRDGSGIPGDAATLQLLPGVGRYTAGAVASFAFEKRAALVDTNVARVLSRVFAPHLKPKRARDLSRLWTVAEVILPRRGRETWVHNQALMELGALICTARVRHCDRCPIQGDCKTRQRELRTTNASSRYNT